MANLNFDTSVTDWTTNSGSATAVPNSIPKTQFESMLTALTPQSDFFDRSIVVNESGTSTYDFRVESDTNTNMLLVDASANGVGIGGTASSTYNLKVTGKAQILGDGTGSTNTELRVEDTAAKAQTVMYGETGVYQHMSTETGDARLALIWGRSGTGQTSNAFDIRNDGTTTDICLYDYNSGFATNPTYTPIQIDNATGNVGIGGAATEDTGYAATTLASSISAGATSVDLTDASGFPTSGYAVIATGTDRDSIRWTGKTSNTLTGVTSVTYAHAAGIVVEYKIRYELTSHGNTLFTSNGQGTEVVVRDTSTTGNAALSLEAYSTYAVMDSNGGTSTLGLRDISAITNNYFRVTNDGTDTDFTISDFNDSNKSVGNTRTPIQINNATGNVGIGVSAHSTAPVITDDLSTGKIWAARSSDITFKGPSATDNPASGEYVTAQLAVDGTGWGWFDKGISVAGSASWSTESGANSPTSEYRDIFKGIAKEYTLLNGAIDSSSTADITVDDTTGFPASGNIKIETEVISYTGTTATTFTGIGRGASSTTAAAHADNATVSFSISNTVSLIDGPEQSHIAIAIRGNDVNDSFTILGSPYPTATDDEGNASDWHYTPMNLLQVTKESVVVNEHGNDIDFRVESDTNANMLFVDGGLNAVGIGNTPLTGYELTVDGQVLIGTNTLTGTGATDNSSGGTPFDTTYGPSGTHPAEVIISQGANSTGTGLLVQSSAANNDSTSIDNATVSIQGNGTPLLQFFDTNGTGNISHIYHAGNTFKVDWSMTNGDNTDTHNILKAMANRKLCQTVGSGTSDSGAMGVHDGVGDAESGDQSAQSISFYVDGSNLKVQYVASDGTTATTGTVCALA